MSADTEILTRRTIGGLNIVPVQKRSPYLNLLIYGDSGVGKTTLAGSADEVSELRPVLVIDIEGGTESLVRSHPKVETVRVTKWKEMLQVYDDLHRGTHDYQTVILDSLTEIQKFNMYQIMSELIERRDDLDPDVPGMREWGKNLEQMRRFVRAFRDLPMNSIFTGLTRYEQDKRTGLTRTMPSLNGKLAQEVAGFLDIVAYYYIKRTGIGDNTEEKRLLLTQATEAQIAKDRTGSLPVVIESPTMKTIFELIKRDEA